MDTTAPANNLKSADTPHGLQQYLYTIRKRWRFLAAILLSTLAISFIYTIRQPKIYEATTSLVIESTAPQILEGVKDVIEMGAASREFYQTQFRIIRSKEIAFKVVDFLGISQDPTFNNGRPPTSQAERELIADRLLEHVKVAGVRDSRIATIQTRDTNPDRAARISNAFANTYIDQNLDFKLEGSRTASSWLAEQSVDQRKQLEDSEMVLYRFKKDRNLLDLGLDDKLGMTRQNLQSLNAKLTDVKTKRLEIEAIRRLIVSAGNTIAEKESLPEIRDNPVIQKLRESYLDLLKIRSDLDSKYGEKHPKFENIQHQLISTQKDYNKELDNVLKAFDKRYQAILDTEQALTKWMNHEKQQALELSKIETEYRPLARDAENNTKVYGLLSQRHKEINLTGMLRSNNVRILDKAVAPRIPISPRLSVNLAVGAILGIIFGLLFSFALEALDNSIRTPENAESIIGAPVLGVIPMLSLSRQQSMKDAPERDLSVFQDPTSIAAEACRSIRTNLNFISAHKEFSVFSVTSPGPKDGKTTVAINLATTMALAGSKILLIDADLRKPRIHKSFSLKSEIGISTVMSGEATLEQAIAHSQVPNLDILPCGPSPPNPAELLHTDKFRKILSTCRERYDRVIIDSPPISPVTDPAIIGSIADGVVLVLRSGHSNKYAAHYSRRQLTDAGARILGVVINQTDKRGSGYGYGYGYEGPYRRYYRSTT